MNKICTLLLLILMTQLSFADDSEIFPEVDNQWLRAAPPNSMMQAAYIEINNTTGDDKILIGAYSPDFNMAEIHKTIITDGVATMEHQPEIVIKANEKLLFKPGGLHIMLMHPSSAIKVGDSVKICLIYKQGDKELVQHIMFPVEKK